MTDQFKLAELWERESAAGNRYFSGFLGMNRVLMFRDGERAHPTRPDEKVTVWRLVLQPKDAPPPRRETPLAQRHRLARELASRQPPKRRRAPEPEPADASEAPPFDDPIDDLGR